MRHCEGCNCDCTCGYGGLHEPLNKRCQINIDIEDDLEHEIELQNIARGVLGQGG